MDNDPSFIRIELEAMREKLAGMIADWAGETDGMIRKSIDKYIAEGQLAKDIDNSVRKEIPKLIDSALQNWEVKEAIRKLILADLEPREIVDERHE